VFALGEHWGSGSSFENAIANALEIAAGSKR
jgi:hypothetical protein